MIFELVLAALLSLQGSDLYTGFGLLLFGAELGAPVSQDLLLMVGAGHLPQGLLDPWKFGATAWLAIVAGDLLTFWTGHYFGARWIRRPWAHGIVAPQRLPGIEGWVRRWGAPLVVLTRLLPGQRVLLFFLAGTFRLPYGRFLLADGIAAALQVPLAIHGVRALGWAWQRWQQPLDRIDNGLTVAILLALVFAWERFRVRR